jgi:transcriptional regulator with XRE-family HTH domain
MMKRHRALSAFGLNVRKQREAKELTQERLAEKAELDPTYISGIERGVRNPSLLSIVRVAKALGISVSDLSKGINGR